MIRLSVNLDESVINALKEVSRDRGISITEALGLCISTRSYLEQRHKEGTTILLRQPDGVTVEQLDF